MGILWVIIIGALAGTVAQLLVPGPKKPVNFFLSPLLGIVGAFLATFIGQAVGWYRAGEGAGLISATLGAFVVLWLWRLLPIGATRSAINMTEPPAERKPVSNPSPSPEASTEYRVVTTPSQPAQTVPDRETGRHMVFDVFISYPHQNKTIADAACAKLEAEGVRCWIAPRDIVPGADWGEAIVDAISRAKVMVLIFSAHANASPQIKREVERAVFRGITVIPVRVENITPTKSLEYFISSAHWLDAITPPLEMHLKKLAVSVKTLMQIEPPGKSAE